MSMWSGVLNLWAQGLAIVQTILLTAPEDFAEGRGWEIVISITNALQGAGYAIMIICFYLGIVKSSLTFMDLKRPAVAATLFVRFLVVKALVDQGAGLAQMLIRLGQGLISVTFSAGGANFSELTSMSDELTAAIQDAGFLTSVVMMLLSVVAFLVVAVVVFLVILNVYGRFFKIYCVASVAPVPLAFFGGESTQHIGISYLKAFGSVLLEGMVVAVACLIYSAIAGALSGIDLFGSSGTDAFSLLMNYAITMIFQTLLLAATVSGADQLCQRMIG